MRKTNLYLERYAYPGRLWPGRCDPDTRTFMVIPVFCETGFTDTLKNLCQCYPPERPVEVLVIINEARESAVEVSLMNQKSFDEARQLIDKIAPVWITFKICYLRDLPPKDSGVGLARKIGMDEAVKRITESEIPATEAVIACYDADCTCAPNYFQALEAHFSQLPESPGASIYFEHPLEGPEPDKLYQGIINYESFLRYYVDGLRYAGFPFAFQTVGSSMAVRADAYQKQGGMNKRKAGEDFHFLQRIFPLGNYTEINSTCVYPSPRVSERVPFGTGKAMKEWMESNGQSKGFQVYHHQAFESLRHFLDEFRYFYQISPGNPKQLLMDAPDSIRQYFLQLDFDHQLQLIKKATNSFEAFQKRFFQWFSGLKALKYVHFARDNFYGTEDIGTATSWVLKNYYLQQQVPDNQHNRLLSLRKLDRKSPAEKI